MNQLVELAKLASFGLSTLPEDREYLEDRVHTSIRGFERNPRKPEGDAYLFVLEDTKQGRLVGTSGIVSKVGGFEPFYAYRIETERFESEQLGVRKDVEVLHLIVEHSGPCEIGSLFLDPGCRGQKLAHLLSRARFLFMADHPELFEKKVIAEMRGIVDGDGRSPVWESLGRHFFDIDYPKADYLSMKNKTFIADLMPRNPIYIPLLPKQAQAVIGRVHEKTAPALHMLESEGFQYSGMVDIFEAGPIMRCDRDEILTIRESECGVVSEVAPVLGERSSCVISNTRLDFRACFGAVEKHESGEIRIDQSTAAALEVSAGDSVRYAPTGISST